VHSYVANQSRAPQQRECFQFHLKCLQDLPLGSPEELLSRGSLYAQDGQWDRARTDFDRATELAPDNATLHYETGTALAAAGAWEQTGAYFRTYHALGQYIVGTAWTVPVALYLHDELTYRRQCRQLLERFEHSSTMKERADQLYLALLASDAAGDPKGLLELTDRCFTEFQQDANLKWTTVIKGMAEYRAGHLVQAVDWLSKANQLAWYGFDRAGIHFFLAMAYHRLNREEEAKAAYQKGLQYMAEEFGSADRYQPGKAMWHTWPWCQVLRREAEAVIRNRAKP
jgi:tetratricopeptide (TPR) repeat protein